MNSNIDKDSLPYDIEDEQDKASLLDVCRATLKHWPWLLLSLAVCLALGALYILTSPKVYMQTASLLIKNESAGQTSASPSLGDFGNFGLLANNSVIQNEISTISSPDLMEEVVARLNLRTSYFVPGTFKNTAIYGPTLPVSAAIPNLSETGSLSFLLDVSTDGSLTISKMRLSDGEVKQKSSGHYTGKFGVPIKTIAGPVTVTPSESYVPGEKYHILVKRGSLEGTIESYSKRLNIALEDELGTVLVLSFADQNIKRADDVLQTVIDLYNQNWVDDKNLMAASTSKFIDERLRMIEQELGNVDSNISTYKSANLVPDVNAAATNFMQESSKLSEGILEASNQLHTMRSIRRSLTEDEAHFRALPSNLGLKDNSLQRQIELYNTEVNKFNSMAAQASGKNPLVATMENNLRDARAAILVAVDNTILGLQDQIKGLQNARAEATGKIASNPAQAKYLLSVERQQKVKESLYLFLLQKREDNALNQAFTAYNSRVIRRPGGSSKPVAPKKSIIMAVALIIGLAIPFGTNYVIERNNTTVRSRKDVEYLHAPMLGEIPLAGSKKLWKRSRKETPSILIKGGSRDIINEAFRVLRTNIEFTKPRKEGCNIIAITSFNPGSGKSFISTNLAASLALKNRKVLLIDGDLRRGSSSMYVTTSGKGLSNYLEGRIDNMHDLMVTPEGLPTLQVLPIGILPPNPTELIESKRFAELLENMRNEYDFIFIDCPPIEIVADTHIISRHADRTVFVLRSGLFERAMLHEFNRIYDSKKYPMAAFILNGTDSTGNSYGKSYGYGCGNSYYASNC